MRTSMQIFVPGMSQDIKISLKACNAVEAVGIEVLFAIR